MFDWKRKELFSQLSFAIFSSRECACATTHKQPHFPKPAISQNICTWKSCLVAAYQRFPLEKKPHAFDYSDGATKIQRETFICPKLATFELGRSFQILQPWIIFGLVWFWNVTINTCAYTHSVLRMEDNKHLHSLHSASVNNRQKSKAQKFQITSSALNFSPI